MGGPLHLDPVGVGLFYDVATGQLMIGEGFALGVLGVLWIGGVVAGLLTSWLVLP